MAYFGVDELLAEPTLAAEMREKAYALNEEHLTNLVDMQKREAYDATAALRESWTYYFSLWQSEVDFSDKEDWQVKFWVPKPFSSVEQSAAIVQRALLESQDTYAITAYSDENTEYIDRVWMPLVKMNLNNSGFINRYVDGAKMGFITGVMGYFKLRVMDLSMPALIPSEDLGYTAFLSLPGQSQKTFIAIDIVPPWCIYRDPESRRGQNFSGSYIYHSEYKDKGFLRQMGNNSGWDAAKIAEITARTSTGGGVGSNAMADLQPANLYRLKQYTHQPHRLRQSYLVDEGWLDILDENGDVVLPDAMMIRCEKKIIFGPVDNPLYAMDENTGRKKWPFIAGAPISHPMRFEGRGIVEQNAPFANLFSNIFMLAGDGMNWIVNPGTEVYQNALVDPDDLANKPGKVWAKHAKDQALMPAQPGKLDLSATLAFLQFVDRERQNNDFTTDFALGLPGSRSEITKGEVQIKTGQSLAIFEMMGRNLEATGKDLVELAFDLVVQFSNPITNPHLAEVLDPGAAGWLANLDVASRQEILRGNYIYTFTGLSNALQKADHLNRVMQFAQLAASPQYAPYVNFSQILENIVGLLGITNRIEVFPEQVVPLSQAKQAVAMAVQQTVAQLTGQQLPPEAMGMPPGSPPPGQPGTSGPPQGGPQMPPNMSTGMMQPPALPGTPDAPQVSQPSVEPGVAM